MVPAMNTKKTEQRHELPPRPEGFLTKLNHYEHLPDEFKPNQSPRRLRCVTTADFSNSPGGGAYFSYYLYSQRHYWIFYVYLYCDDLSEDDLAGMKEVDKWLVYCYAKKGKETAETAAIYMLIDAWTREGYSAPPLIENEGVLTVEDLKLISKAIWGREPNISKRIQQKAR